MEWLNTRKNKKFIESDSSEIDEEFTNLTFEEEDNFEEEISSNQPLKEELRSFLNAVVNGTEPEITGEDGLKALKMVIAATKSSREHKPISFDEIE